MVSNSESKWIDCISLFKSYLVFFIDSFITVISFVLVRLVSSVFLLFIYL